MPSKRSLSATRVSTPPHARSTGQRPLRQGETSFCRELPRCSNFPGPGCRSPNSFVNGAMPEEKSTTELPLSRQKSSANSFTTPYRCWEDDSHLKPGIGGSTKTLRLQDTNTIKKMTFGLKHRTRQGQSSRAVHCVVSETVRRCRILPMSSQLKQHVDQSADASPCARLQAELLFKPPGRATLLTLAVSTRGFQR